MFESDPVMRTAKYAMNTLKDMELPSNPAIIFDIDDTLIRSSNGSCINHIRVLYNYALTKGITPILITARVGLSKESMEYTKLQLDICNIYGYKYIYFRPKLWENILYYKNYARKNVTNKGYNIVMSVGDMEWDVVGEYTGVGILVPT